MRLVVTPCLLSGGGVGGVSLGFILLWVAREWQDEVQDMKGYLRN
jgi:hypothetical protein